MHDQMPNTEDRLTDSQRDDLVAAIRTEGYCVLPFRLPEVLRDSCCAALDRIAAEQRGEQGEGAAVKVMNCADADPAFRRLALYTPALQLAWDLLGPSFHLCQSNCVSRPRFDPAKTGQAFGAAAIDWHADGPRPRNFPRVNGAMGLHYLKFGYFFTAVPADGSPLQVIRGSHLRDELDGKGAAFDVADYADRLVTLTCPAGTIVAFHQAQWHAAGPNTGGVERKNAYISYCPTWMKPFDRELPDAAALEGLPAAERFILGEPREAPRWWLPNEQDLKVLSVYGR